MYNPRDADYAPMIHIKESGAGCQDIIENVMNPSINADDKWETQPGMGDSANCQRAPKASVESEVPVIILRQLITEITSP